MTKEYRAELKSLRKAQQNLTREENTAASNRRRAFEAAEKSAKQAGKRLAKEQTKIQRDLVKTKQAIDRESAGLHRSFSKRGREIAERVSILTGRLGK